MSRSFGLIPVGWVVLLAGPVLGQVTHVVPVDFPTIQLAIDAAQDGDTVLVEAGTYVENISFLGKAISVIGGGPNVTSIDGAGMTAGPDIGTVIRFVNGEGPDSVLEGFEIVGGTGTVTPAAASTNPVGGGILSLGASPTIRNCRLFANNAGRGGGAYFSGVTGALVIEDTTFQSCTGFNGAALFTVGTGSTTLTNCEFIQNSSTGCGGAALIGTVIANIHSCQFRENDHISGFLAGALFLGNVFVTRFQQGLQTALLEDCTFDQNEAIFGGASVVFQSDATFRSCLFRGNMGGNAGVYMDEAQVVLERCTFFENVGTDTSCIGTTINPNEVQVRNCTIVGNQGPRVARVGTQTSPLDFQNTILWGNTGLTTLLDPPNAFNVDYCDVQGDFAGVGNFEADPLFADADSGDFRLTAASPCIDAGNPSSPFDPDGSIADVGALIFAGESFRRGDANADGSINLPDVIRILGLLFANGTALDCASAGDTNDDSALDIADAVFLVNFLFSSGAPLPAPHPNCGPDGTPDALPCQVPTAGC